MAKMIWSSGPKGASGDDVLRGDGRGDRLAGAQGGGPRGWPTSGVAGSRKGPTLWIGFATERIIHSDMPLMKRTAAAFALTVLAGCAAQPPTFGELVAQEGQEAGEIADRWEAGREAVEAAETDIEEARRTIERAEDDLRAAERDLERAETRREAGLRRMRAAEAAYAEAFPDRTLPDAG